MSQDAVRLPVLDRVTSITETCHQRQAHRARLHHRVLPTSSLDEYSDAVVDISAMSLRFTVSRK